MSADEESKGLKQTPRYRWAVLFMSFLAFVIFAFSFQLVPPILNSLQTYFGVDDAQAGLLMSMVVIPGIVLALPAGLLVNRFGFRWLGFLSITSVVVGDLVTALAYTFEVALVGRFILGVGGAFLVVGMPSFIPQWFSHREMGKAMGVYGTNMPVAIIIAFPTATVLAQEFGWRYPFYVAAAVSVGCALLFLAIVKEGPLKGEPRPIKREEIKRALINVDVWKISAAWMLFNTTIIAFLTWAPKLFHQFKGLDAFNASFLASAVMYSAVFLVPIFGYASDRLGRRKPFIVAGSVLMGLTLIATAYALGLPLLFSVLGLGVSAAMVPPLVMTVVAQNLPPKMSGIGFSIATLCQNAGIALSAPLGGFLFQTTQSISLTFEGIALFAFASAAVGLTLKTK